MGLCRDEFDAVSSIGRFDIAGLPECYTLEDRVRAQGVKVDGATAIPYGRYKVVKAWSPKHGYWVPLLVDVPMFTEIEIHPGTTAGDTLGCILVGHVKQKDAIYNSKVSFEWLMKKYLVMWARGDETWLTVYSDQLKYGTDKYVPTIVEG